MDNRCNTDNSVGAGAGEQLHDGRVHSSTSGYRNRCGVGQSHSGTKSFIACMRQHMQVDNRNGVK